MVMTAVALISDFTSVLLDTTDNAILLPRPVDARTLAVARLTHIALYMLLISVSLSLATLVIGTGKYGPMFALAVVIALVFTVLFVVFVAVSFTTGSLAQEEAIDFWSSSTPISATARRP